MKYETNLPQHTMAYPLYQTPAVHLTGGETLVGRDVYNHIGEHLGTVWDVIMDIAGSKVAYAVLTYNDMPGLGNTLFAVPWRALTADDEHNRFILCIKKSRLKDAPGFAPGNWPDITDAQWASNLHNYYRVTPYGAERYSYWEN